MMFKALRRAACLILGLSSSFQIQSLSQANAQSSFVRLVDCGTLFVADVEQAIRREIGPDFIKATEIRCVADGVVISIRDGNVARTRTVTLDRATPAEHARIIGLALAELWESDGTALEGKPQTVTPALPNLPAPLVVNGTKRAMTSPGAAARVTDSNVWRPSAAIETGLRWFRGESALWQLGVVVRYGPVAIAGIFASRDTMFKTAGVNINVYQVEAELALWCHGGNVTLCLQAQLGAGAIVATGSTSDPMLEGSTERSTLFEGGARAQVGFRNNAYAMASAKYSAGMRINILSDQVSVHGPSLFAGIGVGW
jgi:hypothetical protein